MNGCEVKECSHCGSLVRLKPLGPGESLRCGLCRSVVKRHRSPGASELACAFALAGFFFLILANTFPIMSFSVAGNSQDNQIITGVVVLALQGYWPVAILVLFCAIIAPALYFSGVAYVAGACALGVRFPAVHRVLAVVRRVEPWSLVPVFAVACFVSVVKLDLIGHVEWQMGIAWILLLAVCTLVIGSFFDAEEAGMELEISEGKK